MKLRLRSILAALALFLGPSSAAFADPGPNIPDVLSTAEQSIRSAVGGQEEFCTEIATDANTNTFSFPALSDDSNANGSNCNASTRTRSAKVRR